MSSNELGTNSRRLKVTSPSMRAQGSPLEPAWISTVKRRSSASSTARRRYSLMMLNDGVETAERAAVSSVQRGKASATTFVCPGLYSTEKSKPSSLLTQ